MKTTGPVSNLENYTARILALIVLAGLLLVALTGCKHSAATDAGVNPVGVYTLVSVNDKRVPCDLTHEGVAMIVKSGSFTINADGTCRSLSTFAVPPHPDINREVNATYTHQGVELTMHWKGAGVTTGSVHGDEFTMNNEGMIFLYRK